MLLIKPIRTKRVHLHLEEEGKEDEGNEKGEKEDEETKLFEKSKVKCYNCQNFGHFTSECHLPKKTNPKMLGSEDDKLLKF